MALLDETREQTERRNALVASDAYTLSADPTKTYVPPEAQDEVPFLNFAPVQNAITRLEASAAAYDAAYDAMRAAHAAAATAGGNASGGGDMNEHGDVQQRLNAALIQTERLMTHQDGLPRRNWFRHQIYAPGFYTGYGVKTLPGIREAIEQRGWDEASEQAERLAGTLTRLADKIDEAAALLCG